MFYKKCVQFCLTIFITIFLSLVGYNGSFGAEKKLITWGTVDAASGTFPYYVATAGILNKEDLGG